MLITTTLPTPPYSPSFPSSLLFLGRNGGGGGGGGGGGAEERGPGALFRRRRRRFLLRRGWVVLGYEAALPPKEQWGDAEEP